MSRMFPIAVLIVATLVGGVGGFGTSRLIRAVAALPEGAEVDAPTLGGGPDTPRTAANAKPAPRKATTDRQYLETLLCRNLFDPALVGECSFDDGKADADKEAITDLKVTLLATLVAEPEVYSSALILEEGEERAIGYSIHDKIHDAEIVAIEAKRVRLRRGDGREEVLTMDEDAPVPQPRAAAKTPSGDGDEDVRELADNHYEIDSETLDKYLSDLDSIARMGRALLHRGPDGEFDGYRLSAIRRNTIADKLGIRNGDIVHEVNGKPLNSMASAMEAFNTMRNEKNFTFEVTRRGKKQTMTYDVK